MLHNTLQLHATQMAPALRGLAVSVFALLFFLGRTAGVMLNAPGIERQGTRPGLLAAIVILPLVTAMLVRGMRARAAGAATG
jgi:hypothetical protein